MAEDKKITVVCEACGEKELIITKKNTTIFSQLDLFVCPRCVYAWNTIDKHIRDQRMKARTQEDCKDFDDNIIKLVDIAREAILKKRPLPRIIEGIKVKDRLDSIILSEDESD